MKIPRQAPTFLFLLVFPLIAAADNVLDGFALELGRGDDSTEEMRVHAKWNWDKKWFAGSAWYLTGYWEATLGRWQGSGDGSKDLWDIGITPVFRLQSKGSRSGVYLEAAVGAHLLSETRINNHRIFGSNFNFGDHVGFGMTLGEKGRYDLGYRFQHLSNAEIKKPNDGINFHQVRLAYNY